MILPIYLYGSEKLRAENKEADLQDKEGLAKLIADMKETLKVADGCGLAAPRSRGSRSAAPRRWAGT